MNKKSKDYLARPAHINRQSPIPYHQQLHAILEERISSGSIADRSRLPSELELATQFELSRHTVRQALRNLESNGWATHVRNRGYYASKPRDDHGWMIQNPEGFLENSLTHQNGRISTEVVTSKHGVLPEHACKAMGLPVETTGFILERVRRLDGELVLFGTNFLPPSVEHIVAKAEGVLAGKSSLNLALHDAGFDVASAKRIIKALGAPAAVAKHLGVRAGTPLMRIRSVSWNQDGEPFDYYETWLRTEVVPLEVNTASTNGNQLSL